MAFTLGAPEYHDPIIEIVTQGSPDWSASSMVKRRRWERWTWEAEQRARATVQTIHFQERILGANPPRFYPTAPTAFLNELGRRGRRYVAKLTFLYYAKQVLLIIGTAAVAICSWSGVMCCRVG